MGQEQAYAGHREGWDVVAKQSIGSVPELLRISIVTAFRAALLKKPANKERWCKDRASDGSASSCHFCCSFYNAVGSAPLSLSCCKCAENLTSDSLQVRGDKLEQYTALF